MGRVLLEILLSTVSVTVFGGPALRHKDRAEDQCFGIEGGKIQFHGFDVSKLLWGICKAWPEDFPVDGVNEAEDFINETFKPGGVYDVAKRKAEEIEQSRDFCWRQNVNRPRAIPTGFSCPERLNENFVAERPFVVQPFLLNDNDTRLYCEKNCTDICGAYVNRGEVSQGICSCRSAEPVSIGTAGPIFDFEQLPRIIFANPDGCDFVSGRDCFGSCPNASTPSLFVGHMFPVCCSACGGGGFGTTCGYGCADSMESCAVSLTNQVGEVFRSVGLVTSLLTGQAEVALIVDSIVNMAEFAVGALAQLVKQAVNAWTSFWQNKQKVGLVAAILQLARELKKDVGLDESNWERVVSFLSEIISATKGWHGWHPHMVEDIAAIFFRYGSTVIVDGFHLLSAFVRPDCSATDIAIPPATLLAEAYRTDNVV